MKMVPGDTTRPVRDLVKEALFNILGEWVRGSHWLDLFAGTGSIGIEALSRGAASCLFLDTDRAAVKTIHENLAATGLSASAEVRRADAFFYLARTPPEGGRFEIIYVAPPQYRGLWRRALEQIDAQPGWLYPDGLAVAQIHPREYEELSLNNLVKTDERRYSKTLLCFYERPGD